MNEYIMNNDILQIRFNRWVIREAYLEVHKREAAGLPLVDKNLVDPIKIRLPSEEEIGDTDVHL